MNQHIYLGISRWPTKREPFIEWLNKCYLSTQQSFSQTIKYSQIPETKQQHSTVHQTTCKSVHAGRGTWHHWNLQGWWVGVSLVYIRFPGVFSLQRQWKGEASRSRFHTPACFFWSEMEEHTVSSSRHGYLRCGSTRPVVLLHSRNNKWLLHFMFKSPLIFVREYIEEQTGSVMRAESHSSPASPEQDRNSSLRYSPVASLDSFNKYLSNLLLLQTCPMSHEQRNGPVQWRDRP